MFDGNELVWVESPLDAYVIQVNGSAKLRMPDGSIEFIGYDGKTDRIVRVIAASARSPSAWSTTFIR